MTNGWNGPDPTQQNDGLAATYELAVRYTANDDISITGMRVWHGANSINLAGRKSRLWSTGGVEQRQVDIAALLPSGWTEYSFSSPYTLAAGSSIDISYSTQQFYGFLASAHPVTSSDGAVTSVHGRFNTTIGAYPTTVTTSFYGIDIVYTTDTGDNEDPEITGMTVTKADLTATANVTIEDESPETVTVSWDWGDGTTTNTGAGVVTAQHTYTATGLYAILATATDEHDATDTYAVAVQVTAPSQATSNEEWIDDIFDAVVSDVQRSGYFDKVNTHEPKRGPRTGLTAAVWLQAINPVQLTSGLASTSAQLVFTLRMYQSMLKEPQDMIDPNMAKATSNLMRRYHDDFDFDGAIRNIDLLGAFGVALSAISGYLEIDGKMYRIIDMTIPCIVNDVWPQVH